MLILSFSKFSFLSSFDQFRRQHSLEIDQGCWTVVSINTFSLGNTCYAVLLASAAASTPQLQPLVVVVLRL